MCLSIGEPSPPLSTIKGRSERHRVTARGIKRRLCFPAQQVHSVYTTPHCISSLTQRFNIHFLVRRLGNRVHDLQDGLRIPQVDWLVGGISELQQAVSIMSVCFRYRCEMIWQSISKCVRVLGLFFCLFFSLFGMSNSSYNTILIRLVVHWKSIPPRSPSCSQSGCVMHYSGDIICKCQKWLWFFSCSLIWGPQLSRPRVHAVHRGYPPQSRVGSYGQLVRTQVPLTKP